MKKSTGIFRSGRSFLLLLLLCGCAGGSIPAPSGEPAAAQGVSITRLDEGRAGFVIRESVPADTTLRDRFEAGVSALESGDFDRAIAAFEEVGKAAQTLSSPRINLAVAYIRSGRDELAEEPLKQALKRVPGHPLASHEYGLLLRRTGRFGEARAVYEDSLNRFPDYVPLRKNLGVLCDIYLNDRECAAEQFGLFLEARPEDEQVRLWLAEVQGRRGRQPDAQE